MSTVTSFIIILLGIFLLLLSTKVAGRTRSDKIASISHVEFLIGALLILLGLHTLGLLPLP